MCGRFVQAHDAAFYADAFAVETIRTEILPVSYNVAPTDHVYAVAEHEGVGMLVDGRLAGRVRSAHDDELAHFARPPHDVPDRRSRLPVMRAGDT